MNIEIANRLVALRKANGLSQEALAEKLGISRQAISKWERAEASPDTDNLMALAQLYGMTLDALLNTENDAYVLDGADTAQPEEEAPKKLPKTPLQKKADSMLKFPFPLVVVIVYLIFGFAGDIWHPSWLVFLLLPIYYHLAGALEIRNKKRGCWLCLYPRSFCLCICCSASSAGSGTQAGSFFCLFRCIIGSPLASISPIREKMTRPTCKNNDFFIKKTAKHSALPFFRAYGIFHSFSYQNMIQYCSIGDFPKRKRRNRSYVLHTQNHRGYFLYRQQRPQAFAV